VLATDRIYVQWDITLRGANKITAFSYLWRYWKLRITKRSTTWIKRCHQIIRDNWVFLSKKRHSFVRNNTEIIFPSPITSSIIQHIFGFKNLICWHCLYITHKSVNPYVHLPSPTVITLHKQCELDDTYSAPWQIISLCLVEESKKWWRVIRILM